MTLINEEAKAEGKCNEEITEEEEEETRDITKKTRSSWREIYYAK